MTPIQLLIKIKEDKYLFFSLALVMSMFSVALSSINETLGIAYIGLLISVILVFAIIRFPIYASLIHIFIVYLGWFLLRWTGLRMIPLGVVIDVLNILALVALIVKGHLHGHKTTIGIFIFIWFALNVFEIVNPNATARSLWFVTMRGIINLSVPFFLFYSFFKNQKNALFSVINFWLLLGVVSAVYTIYTEFFGYPDWEMALIKSNEEGFNRLFTFGRFRKMGTLAGPSEAGVVLALNSVMGLGLFFSQKLRKRVRYLYLFAFIVSSWGMFYTGTRTATVIWIVGIIFYTIFTKKRVLILGGVIGFFMIIPFLLVTGKGGSAATVMLTAFDSDDPSLRVRYVNQKIIRDYILRAPIGYGLGSTGAKAKAINPGGFIANFPPDSEYVKVAIEYGFLGLILWLAFQFSIINEGIKSLLLCEKDTDKLNLIKTMLCIAIMSFISQYPQEILIQPAIKVLFAICLATMSLRPSDIVESKNQIRI